MIPIIVIVILFVFMTNVKNMNAVEDKPSKKNFDKFGILEIYPTKANGSEWFSKWDDMNFRSLKRGERDPYDVMFVLTGTNPKLDIYGNGTVNMSGEQPRMYVNDPTEKIRWQNTETTIYGKKMNETESESPKGINIGSRSNHYNNNGCNVNTYYSRMLYNGQANFVKELNHPKESRMPENNFNLDWKTNYSVDTMPQNVWIGHKFIIKNINDNDHVKLEMWLDMTDGKNGGDWKLVLNQTDDGEWFVPPTNECSNSELNKTISEAGPSIFVRNTDVNSSLYKNFSIREIESESIN